MIKMITTITTTNVVEMDLVEFLAKSLCINVGLLAGRYLNHVTFSKWEEANRS